MLNAKVIEGYRDDKSKSITFSWINLLFSPLISLPTFKFKLGSPTSY
jgi:hypothetical protein